MYYTTFQELVNLYLYVNKHHAKKTYGGVAPQFLISELGGF
jgi:hypothetical protein